MAQDNTAPAAPEAPKTPDPIEVMAALLIEALTHLKRTPNIAAAELAERIQAFVSPKAS
jgi:hypothetical protein